MSKACKDCFISKDVFGVMRRLCKSCDAVRLQVSVRLARDISIVVEESMRSWLE